MACGRGGPAMSCIFLSHASACLWLRAHLYPGQGMQNTLPCNPLVILVVSKFLFAYWVRHPEGVPLLHSFGRMQDPGCGPSPTYIICQAWHAEQAVLHVWCHIPVFVFGGCCFHVYPRQGSLKRQPCIHVATGTILVVA